MGEFVNPIWLKFTAWTVAIIIVSLNVKFLWDSFGLTGTITAAAP